MAKLHCPDCGSTDIKDRNLIGGISLHNECADCGSQFNDEDCNVKIVFETDNELSLTYDPKNTGSIKAAIVKIKADHLTARIMGVLNEFYQDNSFVNGTLDVTKENVADLQDAIKCEMAIAIESLK